MYAYYEQGCAVIESCTVKCVKVYNTMRTIVTRRNRTIKWRKKKEKYREWQLNMHIKDKYYETLPKTQETKSMTGNVVVHSLHL